jgi:D-mannonate dehydratase
MFVFAFLAFTAIIAYMCFTFSSILFTGDYPYLSDSLEQIREESVERDRLREIDMKQVVSALVAYKEAGNNLNLSDCSEKYEDIGTSGLNLKEVLVPKYIKSIPTDPSSNDERITKYEVCINDADEIVISAIGYENGFKEISE